MGRLLAVLGLLLLASCGGGEADPAAAPRSSVPLDEIVLDTFDGGFVPLSEASPALIEELRDAIRPIYEPAYANDSPLIEDDALVLGYVAGEQAYAYPLGALAARELVNDVIDGVPVLVSYCPLCASAVVFDRRVGGRTLLFGNTSALYESDLVMFDHETGSYWYQVRGEAIVGRLTGSRLRPLPSTVSAWRAWKTLHPASRLLVGDGRDRFDERYARDPEDVVAARLESEGFRFPTSEPDGRLRASELVLAVEAGGAARAYRVGTLGDAAVNDTLGGEPVVVLARAGALATAFRPVARGRRLTFEWSRGAFRDRETASRWDAAGRALSGPLAGARLEALPARRAFWFSIASAIPGIEIYAGP